MRKPIPHSVKKQIRFRVPEATYSELCGLAESLNMDVSEMTRFVMLAVAGCKPERFHKMVAGIVEAAKRDES